jgi:hypothetical protein
MAPVGVDGRRSILSLGLVTEIETLSRGRHGDGPNLPLSDPFDRIAGTQGGCIIAGPSSPQYKLLNSAVKPSFPPLR